MNMKRLFCEISLLVDFKVSFHHSPAHRYIVLKRIDGYCFSILGPMNALITSEERSLKL